MAIDFPDEPEVDEEFTVDDKTWIYDGAKWSLLSAAAAVGETGPTGPAGPTGATGPAAVANILEVQIFS